jgi:hypothetical protein
MDFAATEIDAGIARWLYPRLGFQLYLPPVSCLFFFCALHSQRTLVFLSFMSLE